MQLLDYFQQRFGQGVKSQGNGYNGPCPLCGGEPGKSDRFMVWPDRAEHLGEVCTQHGIRGIWACRKCGASGDTIAWLTRIEGLSFRQALDELKIESGKISRRHRPAPSEPAKAPGFTPKNSANAAALWREYADKLVCEGVESLPRRKDALAWLAARGLSEAACQAYSLGYLFPDHGKYPGRFRPRAALGLEPKKGADGKERPKIFIPRGILVPTFASDGSVSNLRVRRHKEDLKEGAPKYHELEGSSRAPFLLRSSLPKALAVYFVTEAELDAMLIHHASGGVVGALAVRTNRGKPDCEAHALLSQCARICVALDFDEAGREGCQFWRETYRQSVRWPTPEGKDPGDAFRLGVNIRDWICASLPASVTLPGPGTEYRDSKIAENGSPASAGHVDTLPAGQLQAGERGAKGTRQPQAGQTGASVQPDEARPQECAAQKAELEGRASWHVLSGIASLDEITLPTNKITMEMLKTMQRLAKPWLPCPRANPLWSLVDKAYCAEKQCQGHPHCLRELVESSIFQASLGVK